jgi:hypothetical protein
VGRPRLPPVFTDPLYRRPLSECLLDEGGSTIVYMDIVAVLIALAMFAALLGLIYGIERI